MADIAHLNGVPLWYDERGTGDPVVLLHGGLTDTRDFAGNLAALAGHFRLLLPERRGHGHTPDVGGPITVELMAQDMIAFLDKVVGGPAHLVGYSAGGTVALRVALARPDLVDRLVLISAAFHMEGMIFTPVADMVPPPQLVAAYAEVSPDGGEHFPVVIGKVACAAAAESGLDVAALNDVGCRTLVLAGDDDLVTLEHTVALLRGLPDAQLAVVPETSHLLLFEKPELCTQLVTEFLIAPPTTTLMPIRRASQGAFDAGE
jgi:pimeloyl-ACP methyl ester carboxylesterase